MGSHNASQRARYVGVGKTNRGNREEFSVDRVTEREAVYHIETCEQQTSSITSAERKVYGLCHKDGMCGDPEIKSNMKFCPFNSASRKERGC